MQQADVTIIYRRNLLQPVTERYVQDIATDIQRHLRDENTYDLGIISDVTVQVQAEVPATVIGHVVSF